MVKQLEFPFTILRFTEITNMHKYFQLETKKCFIRHNTCRKATRTLQVKIPQQPWIFFQNLKLMFNIEMKPGLLYPYLLFPL